MEIISLKPRSYCYGVVLAIKKVLQLRKEEPEASISILGYLVHNELVVKALAKLGIKTIAKPGLSRLELLELVPPGYVVFSAHGVSNSVRQRAAELGLKILDATCPEVHSTQDLVASKVAAGYEVLYLGKAGHPEAIAVTEDKEQVHLITQEEDLTQLASALAGKKIFVTNQTTLSITDLAEAIEQIKALFSDVSVADEICSATRKRQEAVQKAEDLDLLIVLGDPKSNNTKMLAQIGQAAGIPQVIRISSVAELPLGALEAVQRVGVTAGASTPPYLIRQMEDYLESYKVAQAQGRKAPALPELDLDQLLAF